MTGRAPDAPARTAARHWGRPVDLRLVAKRENAVYSLTLDDGRRLALRLHRTGYSSADEIGWELWWTAELARRGFPVPPPVPAADGRLTVPLDDGRIASAIAWVAGRPLGAGGQPLPGTLADQRRRFAELGGLLAQLHATSDALSLPAGFRRRSWDAAGLLGPAPHWGRFWEHPALDSEGRGLMQELRRRTAAALRAYAATGPDTGLIHADALRENVLVTDAGLVLIDFDDGGFGFRLYDLAVALSQNVESPHDAALRSALVDGYAACRPLRPEDRAALPLFRLLRALASLGWTMGRLAPDDPRLPGYVARAVTLSRQALRG